MADADALSQPRVERMIHEVETVVRNIAGEHPPPPQLHRACQLTDQGSSMADGDCPCSPVAAWVFVDGSILGQEGSVRVLVNTHHEGARPTKAGATLNPSKSFR